jgi:cytochrome P450
MEQRRIGRRDSNDDNSRQRYDSCYIKLCNYYVSHASRCSKERLTKKCWTFLETTLEIPTLDDLNRMIYLERVIKETMRLFPVGPVLFRKVLEDVVIRDIVIPEGSNLLIPVHYIHRNSKYWPNPLKFDPDRFKQEEVDKRPRYCYMPFSIPPRNCIGY